MNAKDYNEEEKYKSFLQIIAIISFITLLIESYILFIHYECLDNIQKTLGITSIVLLLFIVFIGLIFANGIVLHIESFDKFITKGRKNNNITVTILFFSFLFSTVIFIIQDNGAQNSSITNILLLCANFGFFFAKKIRIRYIALISCLIGYLICNIISYTSDEGLCFEKPNFSVIITTIMSILFNYIITSNVTWFIQNNDNKVNQSVEEMK